MAAPSSIRPDAALLPGRRDPLHLLVLWNARKSFWWVLWVGIIVAVIAGRSRDIDVGFGTAESVVDRLLSPLAAVVLALILRVATAIAALVLADPLARGWEQDLPDRPRFLRRYGRLSDRLAVARAYRSLRWTHHVRAEAAARLGDTGRRLARVETAIDVANLALIPVILILAVALNEGVTVSA